MLIITDIAGNTEALTGYRGLKRYRNVSGEKTLAFLILPTDQNSHSFPMVAEESTVEFGGETYRIKQVTEKNRGATYFKEVVAVHSFFDLIDGYVYGTHTGSMTFQAALQFVFSGTSYTWSIVDSFLAQDFENFGKGNRLALFQELLKRYSAEFTLSGTHITFRKKIGVNSDMQFRYNYNVKTITRSVDTNNLSTYIKGFGAKDEEGNVTVTAEYTSPNASIFGIRHADPVDDERYTTVTGLLDRLKAELKDTPQISITLDFVDLRLAGYPYDVAGIGDNVFLIYEPMGLDLETRIVEITEEFTEFSAYPVKTDVTLSNIRNKMADKFVDFGRTQKTVDGIMDGTKPIPFNAMDDAVKRATASLQSAQTELEFNNGIVARSKTNPNDLVIFNSNGIGISHDGGQTVSDAITRDGFVLTAGAIGQLAANNIQIGPGTTFETGYSPTDISADTETNIKEDLRMTAPLPTSLTMNQDGIRASTSTSDRYAQLDYRGLFVNKGAVQIQRPDGFNVMVDGIIQNDFAIVGHSPPFQSDFITKEAHWWKTTKQQREYIDFFTFHHNSRYLKIMVAVRAGTSEAGALFSLEENLVTMASKLSFDTNEQMASEILTVDLGVPTGQIRHLYAILNSGVEGVPAYCRILYMWKEG